MASCTLEEDTSTMDADSSCRRFSSSEVPFQRKVMNVELPNVAQSVQGDVTLVSEFKQLKLEKEAQKNWDLFYKRNSTNFFKDRHWTTREFEELKACREFENQRLVMLEAGCGVGNCLFPLLEEDPHLFVYACDFSPRAIQFVKVLKPGGCVLFRDYGLNDHAMVRFKTANKLGENFYVRQDGTRSYFFTTEHLRILFTKAGYREVSNEYVLRETVNKKEGLCVPRVFVQSKFYKPR
ncbi:tRNA N(3)-methylcytidine methyltransferase METTL6 isoform X2 [Bufo gargarizans]|uniref:tRNA N(3)-methylcytidine methyltransferase METTL6 isoform X2 n=1 Tax=Bufo gargarizans TaxID=30331 RepID=UPI001CF1B748|nr:tRNA N(3)-methylcytidine methyltransferase METTL6 isoform X2 [Bufo gargarizans]